MPGIVDLIKLAGSSLALRSAAFDECLQVRYDVGPRGKGRRVGAFAPVFHNLRTCVHSRNVPNPIRHMLRLAWIGLFAKLPGADWSQKDGGVEKVECLYPRRGTRGTIHCLSQRHRRELSAYIATKIQRQTPPIPGLGMKQFIFSMIFYFSQTSASFLFYLFSYEPSKFVPEPSTRCVGSPANAATGCVPIEAI